MAKIKIRNNDTLMITSFKKEISSVESFISQYKYHSKIHTLKTSMGMESDSDMNDVVFNEIFNLFDSTVISTAFNKLTNCELNNINLVYLLQVNDLIVSIVDSLPDNIEAELSNVAFIINGTKQTRGEILYDLYNKVIEQLSNDNSKNGLLISQEIDNYENMVHNNDANVHVECVKTFLLSELRFKYLLEVDCIHVTFNSFTKLVLEMCEHGRLSENQRLNDALVMYYNILLNILYQLVVKYNYGTSGYIPLLTMFKKKISPLTSQEYLLRVNANIDEFKRNFNILKPTKKINFELLYENLVDTVDIDYELMNSRVKLIKTDNYERDSIYHKNMYDLTKLLGGKSSDLCLHSYGPYIIYYDPDNYQRLYITANKSISDTSEILIGRVALYANRIIQNIDYDKNKTYPIFCTTQNGTILDIDIMKQLSKMPMSQYTNIVVDSMDTFLQYRDLYVNICMNYYKIYQLYESLYTIYQSNNDISLLNDINHYGPLDSYFRIIETIFSLNTTSGLPIFKQFDLIIESLTNLNQYEIRTDIIIDRSWIKDTNLQNLIIDPTKTRCDSSIDISQSQLLLYSNKEYNDFFENYIIRYNHLFDIITRNWVSDITDVISIIHVWYNQLSKAITNTINEYIISDMVKNTNGSINLSDHKSNISTEINIGDNMQSILSAEEQNVVDTIRESYKSYMPVNTIRQLMGIESLNEYNDILSTLDNKCKNIIMTDMAIDYYDNILLSQFIQINNYIYNLVDEIPDDFKIGLIDAPLPLHGLNSLLSAYASDDLTTLESIINDIDKNSPYCLSQLNIKQYFQDKLNIINQNKKYIVPCIIKSNNAIKDAIADKLTQTNGFIKNRANKLILAFYRSILKVIISINQHETDIINIVSVLEDDTKPISRKYMDSIVSNLFTNHVETSSNYALEGFSIRDMLSNLSKQIQAIYTYIKDKIVGFFKFIVGLFKRSKNVKSEIDIQVKQMTPEEKDIAKSAGTPKYYGDKNTGKIYAVDSNNKYIVSFTANPAKPVVHEDAKTVENKIENKSDDTSVLSHGILSIEDILKCSYSKAENLQLDMYQLIMDGKDVGKIIADQIKSINGYLCNDFNNEAKNAIQDSGHKGHLFDNCKFPKLIDLLNKFNNQYNYKVDMGNDIFDFVKNTKEAASEYDDKFGKIDDAFIQKMAKIKTDSSYEEFGKLISGPVPKINESLFGSSTDNKEQIYYNRILTIFKRLVSLYKHVVNCGKEYYQLVYIPVAAAYNIGEIGEKATMLYAGKRKTTNDVEDK